LSEFPQYLYNYSVLRHLDQAMEDLKKADHIPLSNLRTPPWLTFFRVVKEKLRVRKEFDTRHKSMKFCDDMTVRLCLNIPLYRD
jgi:hypothetical protein